MKVAVADYGAGNVRSLCAALERAGADPFVTTRPVDVLEAPLAVVAGVGHVASAAAGLDRTGVADALRNRSASGRPLLGICVGMQLLFGPSDEGGEGLGLLAGRVRRLVARRVPHMGWNTLAVRRERLSSLLAGVDGDDVYFAHSFAVVPADEGVAVARVDHDGPVVAAVVDGHLAGLQFHPERSGRAGARVLSNALRWSRDA
jgi:imidazole glycerol-phosphate synthase subunit HisH